MTQLRDQVSWHAAAGFLDGVRNLDGLDLLERAVTGTIPLDPFPTALTFRLVEVARGSATMQVEVKEWHANVVASAHGGFVSALMDQATGLAVMSALPQGSLAPHISASYRFIRAGKVGDVLSCEAEVVHVGRTFGIARCTVQTQDGAITATGEVTTAITRPFDAQAS